VSVVGFCLEEEAGEILIDFEILKDGLFPVFLKLSSDFINFAAH
jgi:hypothetical protein